MSDHLSDKSIYHNNWCNNLLTSLLNSKSHTDVTIVIGDETIDAHRCILAATIPFFSAMFNSNLDDSTSNIVTIKSDDIEPDIFKLIIDYVYSQEIAIDPRNADLILIAANFLGIESLIDICCDYLRNHLTTDTVIRSKYLGEMVNCEELIRDSNQFICSNLASVTQTLPFLQLPFISLCELIELISPGIRLQSVLFSIILRWINHDLETRKGHLTVLLRKMKICLIQPETLIGKVFENRSLFETKDSLDIILDALIYQMLPEVRDKLTFRGLNGVNLVEKKVKPKAIYIIDNDGYMEILNPKIDKWESVKLTNHQRRMATCATLYGQLYLIGGFEMSKITDSVQVFDPITRKLSNCQAMHTGRYNTSACLYNGRIFVTGGSTDSQTTSATVEIYDPVKDKWTVSSPMQVSRCDHSVVTINNRLCALGGVHKEYSQLIRDVEMLNPDDGSWTHVGKLSCPRRCFGSIVIDNLVYIFGGTDGLSSLKTVDLYDPINDNSVSLPSMTFARVSPLVVYHLDKIYVLGGSQGGLSLKSSEIFDPLTKEWTLGPELNKPAARTVGGVLDFIE